MSNARSARARHLAAETAALATLDTRITALRQERQEAEEALRLAQRRAESLAAQDGELQRRRQDMARDVQAARAAYLQDVVGECPHDALRLIFEACANLPDSNWRVFGSGQDNLRRSSAPFFLSSVCRKWRAVALGFGQLWNYCSLPGPDAFTLDTELRRIDLVLERSSQQPLEILVSQAWADYKIVEENDPFVQCFTKLRQHSERWGRVEIWMPENVSLRFFDVFRCPLPCLHQLSLTLNRTTRDPAWNTHQRDSYLSQAPRLRELDVAFGALRVSTLHDDSLPALSDLRCWDNCSAEVVAQLIFLCRRTLESLDVSSTRDVVPSIPLALPRLHTLSLRDLAFLTRWTHPGMLSFPALKTLSLSSAAISPSLSPFLTDVVPKVTHLNLFGRIVPEALDTLQHLAELTHLSFALYPASKCVVDDEFFLRLSDAAPGPIWPKLRSLRLCAMASVSPAHGEGILHLLLKRNIERGSEDANPTIQLVEITLENRDVPSWLSAEVARVLRSTTQ